MNLQTILVTPKIQFQIKDLIAKSNFSLTEIEYASLKYLDFGLGNFLQEGATLVDILKTERLRITLLILLPNQILPEHFHPSYNDEKGKEETLRVLYGHTRVYIKNEPNTEKSPPFGNEDFYKAKHEINLIKDQQYTLLPGMPHWFQGGEDGSVILEFQNTVDETRNIFTDPNIRL